MIRPGECLSSAPGRERERERTPRGAAPRLLSWVPLAFLLSGGSKTKRCSGPLCEEYARDALSRWVYGGAVLALGWSEEAALGVVRGVQRVDGRLGLALVRAEAAAVEQYVFGAFPVRTEQEGGADRV